MFWRCSLPADPWNEYNRPALAPVCGCGLKGRFSEGERWREAQAGDQQKTSLQALAVPPSSGVACKYIEPPKVNPRCYHSLRCPRSRTSPPSRQPGLTATPAQQRQRLQSGRVRAAPSWQLCITRLTCPSLPRPALRQQHHQQRPLHPPCPRPPCPRPPRPPCPRPPRPPAPAT